MPADGGNGAGTALCLADHGQETRFTEHGVGEPVHPIGGGGAGRADDLRADGIHRAYVVDDAALEIEPLRQRLAGIEQRADALVRSIAAGQ